MAVAYFNHMKSGCFWYRIKHPMDALNSHGVDTRIINLDEDVVMDDVTHLQVYGIYPFSLSKVFKILNVDGKKIVYDIDDASDLIDKTNPFYHSVQKDTGSAREIFKHADHITVATKELEVYARARTSAPITIIPNCYDPNEWTFPIPEREGIRIGFAGSSTHIKDLLKVLPAIKSLQAKHGLKIKFLIMGFGSQTYEDWLKQCRFASTPEGLDALDQVELLMKDIAFEWVQYVDFDLYPLVLRNMALDIGLCPLEDTPFNRCRSSSKAMEYTLAGALALASDTTAYQSDPTCILVKDGEWEQTIETYISNPDLRKQKQKEHLLWIKENRNINLAKNIDLLKSVYTTPVYTS